MNNSLDNQNTMMPGDDASRKASLNPSDILGQYKVIRLLGRGGWARCMRLSIPPWTGDSR